MICVGHEQMQKIRNAAKKSGMSQAKLVATLAKDGAAKINAGTLTINTVTNLIEK